MQVIYNASPEAIRLAEFTKQNETLGYVERRCFPERHQNQIPLYTTPSGKYVRITIIETESQKFKYEEKDNVRSKHKIKTMLAYNANTGSFIIEKKGKRGEFLECRRKVARVIQNKFIVMDQKEKDDAVSKPASG